MASNTPIFRQIAWIAMIPQFMVMGILIFTCHLFEFREPFLFGALIYLFLSFGLRNLVAKDHRRGIKLVKRMEYESAILSFEKSVLFFNKNKWVDKFRFLTLLSSSRMTYKEMGLCNIAFCYSQTNNGQKAKEYYEQVLKEFPENGVAMAGLKMLGLFRHSDSSK